eukprot:SRR837773.7092.p1 GENE.SRR837773.7092~~SRR837773.7092.p1  ORF type:complete len:207 (+),score=46.28 SRR837773.7092:343-963(+)
MVLRRLAAQRRGLAGGSVPTLLDAGPQPRMPPHGETPPSASVAFILFTVGCFESHHFFVALATLCSRSCHTVLPIVTSDGFRYPGAETYQHIRRDVAAFCSEDGVGDWSEPVVAFLGATFKKIACPFSIMSDSLTLCLQTDTILQRGDRGGKGLLLQGKSAVAGTASSPASGVGQDNGLSGLDGKNAEVPSDDDFDVVDASDWRAV